MTATDQYAEFRAISQRLFQVPTSVDGKHRFLFIVRQWWQHDPERVVMIVQAINTFDGFAGRHGDYALCIGSPPDELFGEGGPYQRATWVAEHGGKLTENEQSGFAYLMRAPDGIEVDWRP